jgi:hypothetical protein
VQRKEISMASVIDRWLEGKAKSIPTEYNGRMYRSRFEAHVAHFVTFLGHDFEYELRSFMLKNGTPYTPDFFVPRMRLWIEARGYQSRSGDSQIEQFGEFAAGRSEDYLAIKQNGVELFTAASAEVDVYFTRCSFCGSPIISAWPRAEGQCHSCGGSNSLSVCEEPVYRIGVSGGRIKLTRDSDEAYLDWTNESPCKLQPRSIYGA